MRIAIGLDADGSVDKTIERARRLRERGFTSMWSSQIFGADTLTAFALVGHELRDVDLGTAVVPVQPRHPMMMAAQARTVQDAIGGKLSLGIGLSHRVVVESLWGLSYKRPVHYLREYLEALGPMLRGEAVSTRGERVTAVAQGVVGPKDAATPALLVAALGPKMLHLAGTLTDGTVLWMTGVKTVASHIVPSIRDAAAQAGRPEPRIVCSLPINVTADVAGARQRVNEAFALYPTLPSYAAMLEREGASEPADVALIGSPEEVLEKLDALSQAGATEFVGFPTGTREECEAALDALVAYATR